MLDLVLPRHCVGCARPGTALCVTCLPVAAQVHSVTAGVPVVAAAPYDGAVRAALLAYKERGRRDLAGPLSSLLADSVRTVAAGRDAVLVPVPSTAAAARARGGDHVRRLARRCAVPVVSGLTLVRTVSDSATLGAVARAGNMDHAMAARPPRGRRRVVLVDDITTTGATIREAVRALRHAGWDVCGAAVIAATTRPR